MSTSNSPSAADFTRLPSSTAAKRGRGSTGGSVKGSRAGDDGEDENGSEAGASKRKKRIPQSCTECVRRKIKCDRQQPCSACVRRKRTQFCSFEEEDTESPWALASEVRAINRRLNHLETLFQQQQNGLPIPPSSFSEMLSKPSTSSSGAYALPDLSRSTRFDDQSTNPSPNDLNQAHDAPSPTHSDTESAVAEIEDVAFSTRVPVLRALNAAAQGNNAGPRYTYPGRNDMELTDALTSILAEPLTFDQDGRPRSAVRLGLDLAVSTADLPSVRHDALAQILAVLPGVEISQFLIAKYFAEIEWDYKVLDPVAFPLEHLRYNEMLEQGREDLIDPLWIAVFCMVLALSLEGFWSRPKGMKDLSLFRGLDEAGLKDLPSVWHDASLRALQLGEYGGTPRIRSIQCVILFGQYIQIFSSSGQTGRFMGWFASAVRVAQRLGIHRLGSNPQTMPPDDPALPPGSNSLKREMAARLFHHLVNIDSFLSDSPSRCYLLHPSQYNTARPKNVNLSELSRTDNRPIEEAQSTTYTDASYQIVQCRIAEQVRAALDNLVLSEKPFSYPAVVEQDRALQVILALNVPELFGWDRPSFTPTTKAIYERACLHEEISARIVRLNRPFFSRGYQPNSPYSYSTQQCIDYSKRLISSNYELLNLSPSLWLTYTGTLASSLVLLMDLFHAIDTDESEASIREKRDILVKARRIFDTKVATPALEVVVEEGRKILAALFAAEEARRTTRAAFDMLPNSNGPPPVPETFAQVLKRVSRELAAQANQSLSLSNPLSQHSFTPSERPTLARPSSSFTSPSSSFAQSAASALTSTLPFPYTPQTANASLPPTQLDPSADFCNFFGTLTSEDWTTNGFGSPTGDATNSLLTW
ncbi:uncharacterized protein JCM6883_007137 [Sporobolomyces salmoneus]|uniref:uncharacterized protein n=1 Tax=Sporobolomyces salmoneus TaxID=183962 RepID=UPI00316E9846